MKGNVYIIQKKVRARSINEALRKEKDTEAYSIERAGATRRKKKKAAFGFTDLTGDDS